MLAAVDKEQYKEPYYCQQQQKTKGIKVANLPSHATWTGNESSYGRGRSD
jgi:hypothetical protein